MIFIALIACGGMPTTNEPPKLVSVNGVAVEIDPFGDGYGMDSLGTAEPGVDFDLDVVYKDPEGRHVRIWWPGAPDGLDFDPDATTGVWHVPADPGPITPEWELLLEDTAKDPAVSQWYINIQTPWVDTGGEGYEYQAG